MAGNNLMFQNTGYDQLYINGVPIIEARFNISDVFKKVARISALAVQADPYFNDKSEQQKLFSESHGEGDRIQMDFLEEGAKDILPVFSPLQRLIPEGKYDLKSGKYEFTGQIGDFAWTNTSPSTIFINSVDVRCVSGYGDLTFFANGTELGTVTLPDFTIDGGTYLAYDLAGWLGGELVHYNNWSHNENYRNNNEVPTISIVVSNASVGEDFVWDININYSQYDALGWCKALSQSGDVKVPSYNDDIVVSYLRDEFTWNNYNEVTVKGVTIKRLTGSAYVTVNTDVADGTETLLLGGEIGESFSTDIGSISIVLREASDDFTYHMIVNTELQVVLPSPRFEFDSQWNPDEIIYRWQNMDTRASDRKLDYSSNTLIDKRIDPNVYDEVKKYLFDGLQAYVLRELYRAIGYDKKYIDYMKKYEFNRQQVAFWLKSDTSLQTQYHYAGV